MAHTKFVKPDTLADAVMRIERTADGEPEVVLHPGVRRLMWGHEPEFGPWLRGERERRGITLAEGSNYVGVSGTYLARVEREGTAKAPSLVFLDQVATWYTTSRNEVLTKAGFLAEVYPDQVRMRWDPTVDAFEGMLSHPALAHPSYEGLGDVLGPRVKRAWLQFAYRLEAVVREDDSFELHHEVHRNFPWGVDWWADAYSDLKQRETEEDWEEARDKTLSRID